MRKFFNFLANIRFVVNNKSLPGSLVIVCKEKQGKKMFLLVKSSHSNAITFPSGNLNPFEDHIDAVVRELFEETGLKVQKTSLTPIRLRHKFRYRNLPLQVKGQQRVFLASLPVKSPALKPRDGDIKWARWYSLDKAVSLLSYLELKTILQKSLPYFQKA